MAKGTGSVSEFRKKVAQTHELISTAYHESGHVIYALLHFMKVSSVSVFEDKKFKRMHGATYYSLPDDLETIQDVELMNVLARAEVGVGYAGLIAEKSLFKSISG